MADRYNCYFCPTVLRVESDRAGEPVRVTVYAQYGLEDTATGLAVPPTTEGAGGDIGYVLAIGSTPDRARTEAQMSVLQREGAVHEGLSLTFVWF
jgi:hypothetical protein